MSVLSNIVKWFLYITTSVLIVCAINFSLSDVQTISKNTLWQILLSGLLTSLVTTLFCPKDTDQKRMKI